MAEISERNFLNAESCSQIDFHFNFLPKYLSYAVSSGKDLPLATAVGILLMCSFDFAGQQLCPQPLQFLVPTRAASSMANLCGGRGCTCWQFLSRLSISADSLDQNP